MKDWFSSLFHGINLAIGLAVFVGIMWWVIRANSHMWRLAAADFAGRSRSRKIASKIPETVLFTRRGTGGGIASGNLAYRLYGASTISIYEDGLVLSQIPPFNILCPPLFLPFDEMELKQTSWALWPEPFAFRMRDLPELDIIVHRRVVVWVREHIDRPPFGLGV